MEDRLKDEEEDDDDDDDDDDDKEDAVEVTCTTVRAVGGAGTGAFES